jgi:predicted acetyltransferase
MSLRLLSPAAPWLAGYVAALQAGWSPSTTRDLTGEHLAAIAADAEAFLARLTTRGRGERVLDDGSTVGLLPGRSWWMWDGAFCGAINLRHVPGREALPPHVSGHVGYSVVPWKRRRGHATAALAGVLAHARARGLARVLLTCDTGNEYSGRVILANGGVPASERQEAGKLAFWVATGGGLPTRRAP